MFTEKGAYLLPLQARGPETQAVQGCQGTCVGGGLQWTRVLGQGWPSADRFPPSWRFCFCPLSITRGTGSVLHCSEPTAIHCQHTSRVSNGAAVGSSPLTNQKGLFCSSGWSPVWWGWDYGCSLLLRVNLLVETVHVFQLGLKGKAGQK